VVKRRCTAFVLSDFFCKDFSQQMQIVGRKHDMMGIQIYDRRAKTLPNIGLMNIVDAETGREMLIDTSSKAVRKAHTEYFMRRQDSLNQAFAKSRVDWVSVATDEDYVKAMMQLFAMRS